MTINQLISNLVTRDCGLRQRLKLAAWSQQSNLDCWLFKQMAEAIIQQRIEFTTIQTGTNTNDATAQASHILNPYTAYARGSKLTGSMINFGYISKNLSAGETYYLSAGYYSGGVFTAPGNPTPPTPREEIISKTGSFYQSAWNQDPHVIWTPSYGTPYRVYVTTAKLTGTFPASFGAIDCTGGVKTAAANTCTLTVTLSSITIENVQENVSVPYEITGVAYYNA